MEIWKDIKDYEGTYQISNFGRVKALARTNSYGYRYKEMIHSNKPHRNGYVYANLMINRKSKIFMAHRLVAKAFIPNPDNLPEVNHKDFNKSNNHVSNLEWIDKLGNMRHAHINGKYEACPKGEKSASAKLTEAQVRVIKVSRGVTCGAKLAKEFGVTNDAIYKIWMGKNWKSIAV